MAVDAKSKELRAERLRLIKEKIRETKGEGVNLEIDNGQSSSLNLLGFHTDVIILYLSVINQRYGSIEAS